MKKTKKILLYLIISITIVLPIISKSIGVSDLLFHYERISAITSSLRNGIIKEWIYSNYYKYNYAAGIFYPDFLIIPFCLLTFLHVSDLAIFSIILILSNIATLFIAEYFSKKVLIDYECKNIDKNATVIAILYLLNPKMYIEIVSQSFQRIISLIFIPIIAYAIYTFFKKEKKNNWILLTIGMTLSLYCHLITTFIICMGLAIIYIFLI